MGREGFRLFNWAELGPTVIAVVKTL